MSFESVMFTTKNRKPLEEGSKEDSAALEKQSTSGSLSSALGIGERTPFVGQPSAHMGWQKRYWDSLTSRMLGEPEED